MDILSHTCTGLAVGTVVAAWNKGSWKDSLSIIVVGGFGGALPDLDAFSLWSKFDATVGVLLGLKVTGKQIYFGKYWYSHHAALHSLVAPLFLCCLFFCLNYFRNIQVEIKKNILSKPKVICRYLAFIIGFWFHLLEDMPTPASVWGGVNLLFPSEGYIGGFGKIWWWNNYDIFLTINLVIVLNSVFIFLFNLNKVPFKSIVCTVVFCVGLMIALFQINTRPVSFDYEGHTTKYQMYEQQSKELQKEILGDDIYCIMEALDQKLPVHF